MIELGRWINNVAIDDHPLTNYFMEVFFFLITRDPEIFFQEMIIMQNMFK